MAKGRRKPQNPLLAEALLQARKRTARVDVKPRQSRTLSVGAAARLINQALSQMDTEYRVSEHMLYKMEQHKASVPEDLVKAAEAVYANARGQLTKFYYNEDQYEDSGQFPELSDPTPLGSEDKRIWIRVVVGGGPGGWLAKGMPTMRLHVYAFLGAARHFIKLKDDGCLGSIKPRTIIAFKPDSFPRDDRTWLLVRSRKDPLRHDIRFIDPDRPTELLTLCAEDGALPLPEWEVIGWAWATSPEDGEEHVDWHIFGRGIKAVPK